MLAMIGVGLLPTSTTRATVTFSWATVGDAGNAADSGGGYGSVAAPYLISKHEVSNAQYVEFLNAKDPTGTNTLGLYNSQMSAALYVGGIDFTNGNANGSKYSVKSGQGNKPVVFVSWYDSIRFANWVNNGQGSGDTESGAYTLLGGTPTPSNGNSITRNGGATISLASENEWYKAAYYKGGGTNAGYWDYATQSDAVPNSDQPAGAFAPANSANYYNDDGLANGYNDGYAVTGSTSFNTSQNYLSDVGAYAASLGAYGTVDQSGNVWEWNETAFSASLRVIRGGAWDYDFPNLPASLRGSVSPADERDDTGFRVASVVPEPGSFALLTLGGLALLRRRR